MRNTVLFNAPLGIAALAVILLWGPGALRGPDPAPAAEPAPEGVLARVNGAPITEADLQFKLQNDSHEAARSGDRRQVVLQSLIRREVLAQRAAAEGLDADPQYQEGLRRLEAQLDDYRRQELSELLLAREGEKAAAPTENDARVHFEKNAKRIRTRLHLHMILRRSEALIIEARSAIERGQPFEAVAQGLFPGLTQEKKPWDLGYLPFHRIPVEWRETVYDLKPGEMSGILRGPNERFWLVKLIDAREDPDVTFESVKAAIEADLRANRTQRTREDLAEELSKAATVEMLAPP
jgi:peptidyl-prolyl cis-trans isomerase C